MKLIIHSFLLFATFTFVGFSKADEIKDIRYGKTERRSRLVIESDVPLSVTKSWRNGKLKLEVSGLDGKPSNKIISASALVIISKQEWQENKQIFTFELPINQQSFIRWFKLAANENDLDRLVIDWDPSISSRNRFKEINLKKLKPSVTPTNANHNPPQPVIQDASLSKRSSNTSLDSLVEQSKTALTEKQYRLAISLLNKVYSKGSEEQKTFALEFLGVARERNYQLAFAKQYYQRFLKEYPNSPNADRVQQRLASLIGIQEITKNKTLKKGKRASNQPTSYTRGSLATDYRQSELVNDLGERRQTLSLLGLDMDIQGEYQHNESSLQFRVSGGHYQDLTDEADATSDRLRYANLSWFTHDQKYRLDIGRQRSRGKGIFNRFDGLLFGYGVNDTQTINIVYGFPVASSKILTLDPERTFVGLSYDWDEIFDDIDVSLFALNQTIHNLTDRQAIGGEIKYVNQAVSVHGLIDYDIFYSELNAFLLSGSYVTEGKTRYHWSFNKRKSPYVSTRNSLIGQPADSLEELQDIFLTDEEILDLASDRTLESQTSTLQISKPLNKTYDISGSITTLSLSGAPASGGVPEITESGNQLYLNLYLHGSQMFSTSDSNQIGVRISQLSSSDVWSIYLTSQYRWTKEFSVNGKLRYDNRSNDNGSGQQNIAPSFRLQYQTRKHYVYADLGAIFYTNQSTIFRDTNTDIYYLFMGYRFFF